LTPGRHGFMDYQSYAREGEPAPVAIAIAAEPAAHLAGIANVSYDTDEAVVAGGLPPQVMYVTVRRPIAGLLPWLSGT
ncbi:MAG: UbiD family decarboxylase domain-containing protein, partial [Salinigranum sp.]